MPATSGPRAGSPGAATLCMIEKQFVDTNILIHAFDSSAGERHSRSVQIVEDLWHFGGGCLSMQVLQIQQASKTSFWDAMVLRSASALGCGILWSEDLNPGRSYRGVRVVNPFKEARGVRPARRRHPK